MTKIYIVLGHDDIDRIIYTWLVSAYTTKEAAEQHIINLNNMYDDADEYVWFTIEEKILDE